MLYEQIKINQLEARKAKDSIKSTLLTTLLGEIETLKFKQKEQTVLVPDEIVYQVIKKFIKNIEESLKLRENSNLATEKEILVKYLPVEISHSELSSLIESFVTSEKIVHMKDLPKALKYLEKLEVNFSKSAAVEIFKKLLNI